MPKAEPRRCATYTRKSSEEGLEQDFNSLDAQREACAAYIQSQFGEGWTPVCSRYDDGGFSGGSLERPALRRLLADIEAGQIDTVVVYKVDRLTRSLTDFAKIVDTFDAHEVSFVSVTQQFNTTTSMGRLTLNMLLSFAQFEREVTGERIRDKIAASKRKGLWMGGPVPLGYEPNGRTLVIHEKEAETVRTLYRLYLELGNVQRVKEAADRLGLTSKRRIPGSSNGQDDRSFSRGHLYRLLSNPLYAGRIPHHGESYDGQHPAIVDSETWNAVQSRLAEQAPPRPSTSRRCGGSPLRGKLFDEAGLPLTPTHTVKSGRRYRYYISRNRMGGSGSSGEGWRLPAREVERLVAQAVSELLRDARTLTQRAREAALQGEKISEIVERGRHWTGGALELVHRVELSSEGITIHVDLSSLLREGEGVIRHAVPARIRRRGVETRFVLDHPNGGSSEPHVDPALVKAIVRGRQWFEELASGRAKSLREIAEAEGVTQRYVGRLIPLAFLAPDIVSNILLGTQSLDLTAEELTKRTQMPLGWTEQKALLGFE